MHHRTHENQREALRFPQSSGRRGASLIDVIVGCGLMLIVFLGIAGVIRYSLAVVSSSKARSGAIALNNERMEYLRSLTYTQIGVIGGIPAGNVPQLEDVILNGITYTRRTAVQYTDDPGDGQGGADTNGIISDYKVIRVETSWTLGQREHSVTLVSRVSPATIETDAGGGTLAIEVKDADFDPVYEAQVDIANTTVVPSINIRTYSNNEGLVSFIGAPAASDYQITVSKPGYSTAQTYAVSPGNPNPVPRHLTVTDDSTVTGSFQIDRVSSKTIETYKAIIPQTWQDTFSDASKIASSSNLTVSGGTIHLSGPAPYPLWGGVLSLVVTPQYLSKWKSVSWSDTVPASTTITYRIYDGSGSLVPDGVLPGNAAGFTVSPVDISVVPIALYPSLQLGATIETEDDTVTASASQWSLTYDYGPEPLPDLPFTLRGGKTIGNGPAVYKYQQSHDSGAGASVTITGLEWDSYVLSVPGTGYAVAEVCEPQPEALAPNSSQTSKLYVKTQTANSLLVTIRGTGDALIEGASAQLEGGGYDTTVTSSSCGQAFFDSMAAGEYTLTVTAPGYQQYSNPTVSILDASVLGVTLVP